MEPAHRLGAMILPRAGLRQSPAECRHGDLVHSPRPALGVGGGGPAWGVVGDGPSPPLPRRNGHTAGAGEPECPSVRVPIHSRGLVQGEVRTMLQVLLPGGGGVSPVPFPHPVYRGWVLPIFLSGPVVVPCPPGLMLPLLPLPAPCAARPLRRGDVGGSAPSLELRDVESPEGGDSPVGRVVVHQGVEQTPHCFVDSLGSAQRPLGSGQL